MNDDDSELNKKLERLKHLYGLEYEMIRAISAFEHAALRPLFLLNGGALVVYLGLFGALGRGDGARVAIDWSTGRYAVWLWLVGLLSASVAAFLGALSQFAFRKLRSQEITKAEIELGLSNESDDETNKAIDRHASEGRRRRFAAVIAGIVSFFLFVVGFWPAFTSITN